LLFTNFLVVNLLLFGRFWSYFLLIGFYFLWFFQDFITNIVCFIELLFLTLELILKSFKRGLVLFFNWLFDQFWLPINFITNWFLKTFIIGSQLLINLFKSFFWVFIHRLDRLFDFIHLWFQYFVRLYIFFLNFCFKAIESPQQRIQNTSLNLLIMVWYSCRYGLNFRSDGRICFLSSRKVTWFLVCWFVQ
jgi:hypothetical protein